VLASKELLVMPEGSVTLNVPMDEDAQFVAVVRLFMVRRRRICAK